MALRFGLTDMRLILTGVECGSLTQGARMMHLALVSVSERIAGMDAALGAPLLERNRRGVLASHANRVPRQSNVAFADILGEPIVGMADTVLETHLAERASLLGRQLDYRIQLRNPDHVTMYVEAGIGISILSDGMARTLRRDLATLPLSEAWAARRLYLCARDFTALPPHAGLLVQQLLRRAP